MVYNNRDFKISLNPSVPPSVLTKTLIQQTLYLKDSVAGTCKIYKVYLTGLSKYYTPHLIYVIFSYLSSKVTLLLIIHAASINVK